MFSFLRKAANALIFSIKNSFVFRSIIPLGQYSLNYYSILQGRDIDEQEVMKAVDSGDIIVVKNLVEKLNLGEQVDQLCRESFACPYQDLENIHRDQSVEQILENAFTGRNDPLCLTIQSSIMARLLEVHSPAYYLELQPNLRPHLPYRLIREKEQFIESRIGRGKLNPHGQHKDSWRFHPENTLNVWLSLTAATPENGLALLPQSQGYCPRFSETEQEIEHGVKTYPSQQWVTDLDKGDALIFKAELLHGSIINMSENTRFAFSMRCSIEKPVFHRDHQYNYIGVDRGSYRSLLIDKVFRSHEFAPESADSVFPPSEARQTSIEPKSYDEQHIVLEVDGNLRRFPRYCPHAQRDLLFGELSSEGELLCPSHRMRFKGKACDAETASG